MPHSNIPTNDSESESESSNFGAEGGHQISTTNLDADEFDRMVGDLLERYAALDKQRRYSKTSNCRKLWHRIIDVIQEGADFGNSRRFKELFSRRRFQFLALYFYIDLTKVMAYRGPIGNVAGFKCFMELIHCHQPGTISGGSGSIDMLGYLLSILMQSYQKLYKKVRQNDIFACIDWLLGIRAADLDGDFIPAMLSLYLHFDNNEDKMKSYVVRLKDEIRSSWSAAINDEIFRDALFEQTDPKFYFMCAELKVDISISDTLQYFRSDYNMLMMLLSVGAIGTIQDGQDLRDIANDSQNLHTAIVNAYLRRHVHEANIILRNTENNHVDMRLTEDILLGFIDRLNGIDVSNISIDTPSADNRSLNDIKDSVLKQSVHRFFDDLVEVHGGLMKSGQECLDLVYRRLLIELKSEREVTLILLQGLLQAGNEYSWGASSCAAGSISIILSLLQGRVSLDSKADQHAAEQPSDVDSYLKLLKDVCNASDVDMVRAEAISRLMNFCESKIHLTTIVEHISDADYYDWAVSHLRGCFFECLTVEFGHLLAKLRIDDEEEEDGVIMLPGMQELLSTLKQISSIFTKSVTEPSEIIPQILVPICNGYSQTM